jgi:four helix bundle protein
MLSMRNFRNLDTWQMGRMICRQVYAQTRAFPPDERFGLTQQMRRSAVSIPSNIAEGAARGSDADFRRFLFIARGSAAELETQLLVATDLDYVATENESVIRLFDDIDKTQAMLGRLIQVITDAESTAD